MNMPIEDAPKQEQKKSPEKITLRILVAEDDETIRQFYELLLGERYSFVKIVEDGQLLLDELNIPGQNYDFVITDNQMFKSGTKIPGKSGIEALKEIRAMEGLENLPVIVATGDHLESEVGALGGIYIKKPFGIKELYTTIDKFKKDLIE